MRWLASHALESGLGLLSVLTLATADQVLDLGALNQYKPPVSHQTRILHVLSAEAVRNITDTLIQTEKSSLKLAFKHSLAFSQG